MASHGKAMIVVRMAGWIEMHGTTIVHTKRHAGFGDALYAAQLAVRNLQVIGWCGELDAVAHGEAARLLAVKHPRWEPGAWITPAGLCAGVLSNGHPYRDTVRWPCSQRHFRIARQSESKWWSERFSLPI